MRDLGLPLHTKRAFAGVVWSLIPRGCLLFGLALCGCGSVIEPFAPGPPSLATLTGNWLVTGSLPNSGPVFPLPSPPSFGLALSLDESNGQVIANDSFLYSCSPGGGISGSAGAGGSGYLATAQIAADGSFTLQTSGVSPPVTFTLHGTVPQGPAETWSGTYSANDSNAGCVPLSGSFTALPIQPVTGTFAGSTNFGTSSNHSPLTVNLILQQGSPGFVTAPNFTDSQNVLSGSITVQGTSCFSSGSLALGKGQINGGFIQALFTMNDGSTLHFDCAIEDTAATTVQLTSILVVGGQCNGLYSTSSSDLIRQ